MRLLRIFLLLILGLFFVQPAPLFGKQKPVKIDLYVMGQCPFSAQLENTLALVMKETKNPIEVHFFYIASETADGDFTSLRGPSEVEENMRQLVIQKYYPDKFWKYLQSRNTEQRPRPDWKPHVYWAGLSPEEIEKKVLQEGKPLLRENIKKAEQMGIKISPTTYINDQPYQGSRALPALTLALTQKEGKGAAAIPDCFSDFDCVNPSENLSGRCMDPGTLKARCESLTIPLMIIVPRADFPLQKKPMETLSQQIPNLKPAIRAVTWDSPEGKEWLQKIPSRMLPLYLWGENFNLLDTVPLLKDYHWIQPWDIQDGKKIYSLTSAIAPPNFYLDRPRQPNHVTLFVMSQCPFGTWAENQILPIVREKGFSFAIHYIVDEKPVNEAEPKTAIFSSLHGPAELEENMRQLCVRKYFPTQHIDYLLERDKNFNSSLWDQTAGAVLGEASVPIIRSCVQQEGDALLADNIQFTKELGIRSSPTVLWENQYRFNNLNELKQNVPVFSGIEVKEGGCGSNS